MPFVTTELDGFIVNSEVDDFPFGNAASITKLADGGFVVMWSESTANDGSQGCVQARFYNANGVPVGNQFIVNTTTTSIQAVPDVVQLPGGNLMVVWQDNSLLGGDASSGAIKGQILSATGTKIGGEFLVNTITAGNQGAPSIVLLGNGNTMVLWTDAGGSDGNLSGIKGQVLNASGTKIGGEFLVNTQTTGSQAGAQTAILGNGNVIVTWTDQSALGADTSSSGIKAQILDSAGNKVGGEFLVNSQTANAQTGAQIAVLTNGNFVVTWQDASLIGGDGDATGIKAQLFDPSGTKIGGEFLVNSTTQFGQTNPTITAMGNGSFIIAWRDAGSPTATVPVQTLRAQAFNADGTRLGAEFLARHTDGTGEISGSPMIADLGNNRFIVTSSVAVLSNAVPPTQLSQGLQGNIFVLLNQVSGATPGDDTLTGDAVLGDSIDGLGGNDTIHGLGGIDVISGGDGDDTLFGDDGNDVLNGDAGNDTINGGAGDDTINGGTGTNIVNGGTGNDEIILDTVFGAGGTIDGGADFDTLVLRPQAAIPGVFGLNATTYQVTFPSILNGIEAARFESGANDALVLVVLDNQRIASGLNTLTGGLGRDVFVNVVFTPGTYTMANYNLQNWTSDILNTRSDYVALFVSPQSTGNYVLNALEGLASTQSLVGALGDDILNGSSGSEFLNGNEGVNQLFGNGGDDALTLSNVTPFGGVATNRTYAGNLYDGGSGTDGLDVSGVVDFQGTLVSIERIYFQPAFTATAPGQNSQAAAVLTLTRAQTTGLASNLNLFGNGTLRINLAANESFNGSAYTVDPGYTVNVILNGSTGSETITGTVVGDAIDGGDGNDTLNGGGGANQLIGGAGDDTINVGAADSGSSIDGGSGADSLVITGNFTAGGTWSGIESVVFANTPGGSSLTLTAAQFTSGIVTASISGTGALSINMAEDDLLFGMGAATFAPGSNILLTINGSASDDSIKGIGSQANTIFGGDGADLIRGGNRADIIDGGTGDDKIIGGAGADVLTGGTGADVFRYVAQNHSGTGVAADRITDFVIGTDRIGLSQIDPNPVAPGDQAFAFIGTAAFSAGGAAQVRYMDSGANLLVQCDLDGNGTADMEIVLLGLAGQSMSGGDFLL